MPSSELHTLEPATTDEVPGAEQRRERQRSETRRAILDAVEALLIETGSDQFSIRSLGARCGYSAPTVYHYFGDKDGLIRALLEERMTGLADELDRVESHEDRLAELHAIVTAYVAFSVENPSFSRLMWSMSSKGESRLPRAMERVRERFERPIAALVEEGRVGDLDAETIGQMLWAVMRGLTSLQVIEPDYEWVAGLTERTLRTFFAGMSATTPPARQEASRP